MESVPETQIIVQTSTLCQGLLETKKLKCKKKKVSCVILAKKQRFWLAFSLLTKRVVTTNKSLSL